VATLRLLSYNVRSLRDDARALARVVRSCDPDVVCVQEAPRFLRWRSRCAALARDCGLVTVTGGRPAGAMLLLTRLGVTVVESRDVLLTKAPRLHQRGLALAVLEVAGRRVGVGSMHLDLEPAERLRHVPEVLAHLDALGVPAVVAGDVNETPDEPAWRALTERLRDAYTVAPWGGELTSTALRPYRRIDGVFVDPALRVERCGVPDTDPLVAALLPAASDHRPVLAVLEF
jgi:endonuclease/exonuclease/phosphatase family metal-dependent hydrolase